MRGGGNSREDPSWCVGCGRKWAAVGLSELQDYRRRQEETLRNEIKRLRWQRKVKMYKSIVISLFLVIVHLWSGTGHGHDYYEILHVSKTADQKEIRRAFKKLAVIEHPDKNNDNPEAYEKFIRLTRAYDTLKDPISRKRYDSHGEEGVDNASKKGTYHSWSYYANNFGIYDDDPWIVTLDENDYFESVTYTEKVWLINFYSPLCGHCHQLAPIWKRIAQELDGAVRMAAVNCEDEWRLCRQIGIRSYPTLMHHPKNSKNGEEYSGARTYTAIMNFILSKLEIDIYEIEESLENFISRGTEGTKKPMLIFVCGAERHCFTSTERSKIAAIFENTIDVRISYCGQEKRCGNAISHATNAVYLSVSPFTNNSWHVVSFENIEEAGVLIEKVMGHLPEPCDLDAIEFQNITNYLKEETSESGWLVYFYIGRVADSDPLLKRLPGVTDTMKLGKINCGKYSHVCSTLGVNRYPMWGIVKPGGAFELYHGKNSFNDIVKFLYSSVKAVNVWALTAEQVTSIVEGKNGVNDVWFLDWYAPWCPPCVQFLKELRKASMEFHKSIVRFGTIDCTVHSSVCRRYNIRAYPTAMLINGTNAHKFSMEKTAFNIVQFVNEARNPVVVRLTSRNFEERLGERRSKSSVGKTIWLVEYFAPWCASCQRLKPEWIAIANSLAVLSFVKVASVDCETESILCSTQGIRSYPTIRIYSRERHDSTMFDSYNGQRESLSILTWITQFFPRKLRELDPLIVQREVLSDQNVWIVLFFVPWCERSRKLQPQFAIAGQLLKKTIRFGRFNCDIYAAECMKAGIKLHPTLMVYDSRFSKKKLADGFQINGTIAEDIKRSVLDFTARVSHDEL